MPSPLPILQDHAALFLSQNVFICVDSKLKMNLRLLLKKYSTSFIGRSASIMIRLRSIKNNKEKLFKIFLHSIDVFSAFVLIEKIFIICSDFL